MALLLVVSWLSGRKVKNARQFMTGGNANSWMVFGALMGTLVGGQSTVGTAQLAFCYGISAWWFTIGAALGALVLALVYAGPIRRSGCTTLLEVVSHAYGRKAETIGSILFLVGIFISIMSQVLSSSAMVTSLFHLPMLWAAVVSGTLIMLMVLFGGIRSAGFSGLVKVALLAISSLVAGVTVWMLAGGLGGIRQSIDVMFSSSTLAQQSGLSDIESIHHRYGSPVARGFWKDIGGCLSLMLGVLCTQSYAQCIWSGATTAKARRGGLFTALCIPFIGAACTLVGMYMRGHYVTADEASALQSAGEVLPAGVGIIASSAEAFPAFVLHHLPAEIGGVVLGTLFINILGSGSGLSLGAATIMVRDIYGNVGTRLRSLHCPMVSRNRRHLSQLSQTRLSIVGLLALAVVMALSFHGTFINDLGYLSLGLRAVAILFPITFALFLPRRFDSRFVIPSMIAGTAAMLLAQFLALPGNPLYYGLVASGATLFFGFRGKGEGH